MTCECPMEGDRGGTDNCSAESDAGNLCTRPNGHEGQHAACSVAEHPVETWEVNDG